MAFREIDSALGSLFRNMPHARWVNSVEAVERHRFKTHQLQLMAQAGLRIPKTLVTNDSEAVRQFYEALSQQVIYKPVSGGAHTQKLKAEDLTDERLSELRKSPVQFQEYIPGVDTRVYVVGNDVFAAEIQAGTLDFRDDPAAPIVPVELPERIAEQCHTVSRLMDYVFTGIDLRRTPDGAFVFIEANPSPMFMHFESITGYPISERLIGLLQAGNR
jgi:glutathione synthase/RimK-type ligase-like ATP-grasp enzyme